MASNNDYYYSNKPLPVPSRAQYDAYTPPSTHGTPAPPYSSLAPSSSHLPARPVSPISSPFESVFDDHVYPADSRQGSFTNVNKPYNQQDTAYYGPGRLSPDDRRYTSDDIPLQDRPPIKDPELNDHVYEAEGRNSRQKNERGGVRFGQLGMVGSDKKRIPWVVYVFSVVQVAVFIGEIIRNATLTGSPIMIHPTFNPMIGPSTYVLINMGARYVACMHNVPEIQGSSVPLQWPCPNFTDPTNPTELCQLSDLCGFGGVPNPVVGAGPNQTPEPNQWFRFITPIFLHAGIIHIGFNLLLQLTMGKEMEMAIGSIRFFLVYMSSGIFGFVMGGNYAATGIASTGASGALFGVIALTLLDLLYSWKDRRNPVKDLLFILLDVVISFVLGLLPGLDNFSHIGGFLMGMGLGICVLHSPNSLRRRIGSDDSTYAGVADVSGQGPPPFHKNPVGFFKGRKPLWWAWWLVRAASLVTVIVVFIVLLNNFYVYHHTCSWCKYLSCLPVNGWCDLGNLNITSNNNKRAAELFLEGAKLWE